MSLKISLNISMKIKFIQSLKDAFKVLKDGRLKKTLLKVYLLLNKLLSVLSFLRDQDSTSESNGKAIDGLSKGLGGIVTAVIRLLKFLRVDVPVYASDADTLEGILGEVDELTEELEETSKKITS